MVNEKSTTPIRTGLFQKQHSCSNNASMKWWFLFRQFVVSNYKWRIGEYSKLTGNLKTLPVMQWNAQVEGVGCSPKHHSGIFMFELLEYSPFYNLKIKMFLSLWQHCQAFPGLLNYRYYQTILFIKKETLMFRFIFFLFLSVGFLNESIPM